MVVAVTVVPDWIKGVILSLLASIIGGASKLSIRKSWLLVEPFEQAVANNNNNNNTEEEEDQDQEEEYYHHVAVRTRDERITPSSTSPFQRIVVDSNESNHQEGDRRALEGCTRAAGATTTTSTTNGTTTTNNNNDNQEKIKQIRIKAWCLRGLGLLGMTTLNPFCSALAMNYASPSVTAPFSGLTIVWIVLFSDTLIGERPQCQQVFAAGLIILGEVLVSIFGDHTNDENITLEELTASYRDPGFLCFFVGLGIWMSLLIYWMKQKNPEGRQLTLKRFAWGVAGGSISGLQNFPKDAMTIMKASSSSSSSLSDGTQSVFPHYPWCWAVMVLLAIASLLCGLLLLTACIKLYDTTYAASMFVGSFVISASIMSALHYHTFDHLYHWWNFVFYLGGLVVLLLGVYIMVQESQKQWDTNQGDNDDDVAAAVRQHGSPLSVSGISGTELKRLVTPGEGLS